MLEISVIIACLNGAETLAETLASLVVQEWGRSWEIVLADNGSTDASVEIFLGFAAAHPGVPMRVIEVRQKGKPHALNAGIRAARGRALLFCDADDTVAPGWLAAMGGALDRHPFVAARIDLHALNPDWTLAARRIAQEQGLRRLSYPPHALVAGGATLGFHREVFEAAGPFDPAFPVMEDMDFCIRAHLAGHVLAFVPEAVYHYRFRGDLAAIRRQAYSYNYYRALLRRRHGAEPFLTPGPWVHLIRRAAKLARRRAELALRRRTPGRDTEVALATASGQLWGQVRGAIAFRVAPPRPGAGRSAPAPGLSEEVADTGDFALTPPA